MCRVKMAVRSRFSFVDVRVFPVISGSVEEEKVGREGRKIGREKEERKRGGGGGGGRGGRGGGRGGRGWEGGGGGGVGGRGEKGERDRGGTRKKRREEGRVLEHATVWMPQLRDGLSYHFHIGVTNSM